MTDSIKDSPNSSIPTVVAAKVILLFKRKIGHNFVILFHEKCQIIVECCKLHLANNKMVVKQLFVK